ncbi:hypothetical protein [Altericroceibacterium endophyticum]|uniref:Uncharacterized protein n=1 Tax=Altericroceibacterium endophyticum TaxID=1808508 RepID=A0A6I4T582_9SPHN|nr:hypothetical protein [Altericroceibacterium endophyticum]MXO64875.1 hypothetical protein [Altericroceibacterium endophyticum]
MTLSVQEQLQADKARELIAGVGGLEPASDITDLSTSQLGRYQSKHERDSMPARVIEQLEAVTHGQASHPVMTRHLARRQGFVLVPLPNALPGEGEWNRHIARLSQKAGDLIAGLATDLADDQDVSPREAKKRIAPADRLVEIAAELRAALIARAEGDC